MAREKEGRGVAKQFIDRWFVPDVVTRETMAEPFLRLVEAKLSILGKGFGNPEDKWLARCSVLNLGDLMTMTGHDRSAEMVWRSICQTLDFSKLYFDRGAEVPIREYDLLVTTPVAKAKEHIEEARGAIDHFKETGEVDYYYRVYHPWGAPKTLKVGSKLLYVDRRAVRGFAVVGDLHIDSVNHGLYAIMPVDTWRWIDPLPCSYDRVKPPQGYAYALQHSYMKDVKQVEVVGEWLDPMPT